MTRGDKYKSDNGKRMWDLLPFSSVGKIVDVLGFGAKKYGPRTWQKVPEPKDRYFAAAMRHLVAWQCGEKNDPESGLHHLAHAGCCILFLLWFDDQKTLWEAHPTIKNPERFKLHDNENVDNDKVNVTVSDQDDVPDGGASISFGPSSKCPDGITHCFVCPNKSTCRPSRNIGMDREYDPTHFCVKVNEVCPVASGEDYEKADEGCYCPEMNVTFTDLEKALLEPVTESIADIASKALKAKIEEINSKTEKNISGVIYKFLHVDEIYVTLLNMPEGDKLKFRNIMIHAIKEDQLTTVPAGLVMDDIGISRQSMESGGMPDAKLSMSCHATGEKPLSEEELFRRRKTFFVARGNFENWLRSIDKDGTIIELVDLYKWPVK